VLQKAGIEKKISSQKLRHTDATHLLNAGAERVDLQALLDLRCVALNSECSLANSDPHIRKGCYWK
jgi:site-specific recombinase XerD